MSQSDTIFALSSGPGRSGVSVFRVSGPQATEVLTQIAPGPLPRRRYAILRQFLGVDGAAMDEGLVLFFKGPDSFTGEDVCEFHTHGSPAITEAMAQAFLKAGARQAEPGEFTRRAFDNGKMDLTEAEGLADLIDADTELQRRQAFRQMQGGLKSVYEGWREDLIAALASIEGEIDFPDEADVPDALSHVAYQPLSQAINGMNEALHDGFRGERIRHGLDIAIIGPPNVGKSTLINYLTGRDTAIVSDIAGTTRDIVDAHFEISGLPVRIADTAGLRVTADAIEAEGVKRAVARSEDSDIRIGVVDASDLGDVRETTKLLKKNDILFINKIDIHIPEPLHLGELHILQGSAKTEDGLSELVNLLGHIVAENFSVSAEAGLTRARHRDCVSRARDALMRARDQLVQAPELAGDDVRVALHSIKELAGETDIEAVLDAIFSRFCIGK